MAGFFIAQTKYKICVLAKAKGRFFEALSAFFGKSSLVAERLGLELHKASFGAIELVVWALHYDERGLKPQQLSYLKGSSAVMVMSEGPLPLNLIGLKTSLSKHHTCLARVPWLLLHTACFEHRSLRPSSSPAYNALVTSGWGVLTVDREYDLPLALKQSFESLTSQLGRTVLPKQAS